jgi:WD40 repeat protein
MPIRRSNAARLFGYDIFISFALGPSPRGTHSYASDLARRLRERDFTVFFSEDEAPPGDQLDSTLRRALLRSKALVVIANRGTLAEPRWVRREVEEFCGRHPSRPVIPISVDGALLDPALGAAAGQWLQYADRIWLDESKMAAEGGIASDAVVERLALAPTRLHANARWRWVVRGVVTGLALLAIGLAVATKVANDSERRARAELRRSIALRVAAQAPGLFGGTRVGGDERGLLQLLAAGRVTQPLADVDGAMLSALASLSQLLKVVNTGSGVTALAYSPDGSRVITGGEDGTLQLRDATTLQPIGAATRHPGAVHGIGFSPDGARLATGGDDGAVHLYSAANLRPIAAPSRVDAGGVPPLAQAGAVPPALHASAVHSIAFSPDNSRLVSGGDDGALHLWDARTGEPLGQPWRADSGLILGVAFSADGARIVSAGTDAGGEAAASLVWDLNGGRPLGPLIDAVPGAVNCVAVDPKGHLVALGLDDGSVEFWSLDSRRRVGRSAQSQGGPISSLAFSPDGGRIVAGGYDGIRLWDAQQGTAIAAIHDGHQDFVEAIAFSPDGERIVAGSADGTLRLWSATNRPPLSAVFETAQRDIYTVAYSPRGGKSIVSGSEDNDLRLWDAVSGVAVTAPLRGHRLTVNAAAFSPDGRMIASGGADGTVRRWNAVDGQPIGAPLAGHEGPVQGVAFSRDGLRLVSAGHDGTLRFWNPSTGAAVGAPLAVPGGAVYAVAFSPGGARLVSAGEDGTLRFWDAVSGAALGTPLQGPSGPIHSIAISPDGSHIVAGGTQGALWLWHAMGRAAYSGRPLRGIQSDISSVAFTPDGLRFASGSADGTLQFWETNDGAPIGPALTADESTFNPVLSLAFSPDGSRLMTGGSLGMTVWPAPDTWAGLLCAKLTRNLSPAQWREWISPEIEYQVQCPGLPAGS